MRIVKKPLVVHVAEQLQAGIQNGEWLEWLPSEIRLAKSLGVSRTTLRQALKVLREQGVIETHQGKSSRIVPGARLQDGETEPATNVTMLSPVPMGHLRQHTLLWIDELRSLLHEAEVGLHFYSGLTAFRGNPKQELEKVAKQYPSSVWLLFWAPEETQKAVAELGIPAITIGAADPQVDLASASVDNESVGYHAVGQFTARGHRKFLLVNTKKPTTGNLAIEKSFVSSARSKFDGESCAQVIYAEEDRPNKLKRDLLRSLKQDDPPTAFLFINPQHMLTAYNAFQASGYSIPEDVSLISAFADKSFDYLCPSPAHYRMDPQAYSNKLFNLINKLREGVAQSSDSFSIIPDLVAGQSIGRIVEK